MTLPFIEDPEKLQEISEVSSKILNKTLIAFAREFELLEDFNTVVTFRLKELNELFVVQREGCENAVIYANGYLYLSLNKKDKEAISLFKLAALKAIRLANKLSSHGNALVTGDIALSISKTRKAVRRTILSQGYNALDDRYFFLSGNLTLTSKLSDTSVSTPIIHSIPIQTQIAALKHHLSNEMLQDAETEELVDLLELSRSFRVEVEPTTVSIKVDGKNISTSLSYP